MQQKLKDQVSLSALQNMFTHRQEIAGTMKSYSMHRFMGIFKDCIYLEDLYAGLMSYARQQEERLAAGVTSEEVEDGTILLTGDPIDDERAVMGRILICLPPESFNRATDALFQLLYPRKEA